MPSVLLRSVIYYYYCLGEKLRHTHTQAHSQQTDTEYSVPRKHLEDYSFSLTFLFFVKDLWSWWCRLSFPLQWRKATPASWLWAEGLFSFTHSFCVSFLFPYIISYNFIVWWFLHCDACSRYTCRGYWESCMTWYVLLSVQHTLLRAWLPLQGTANAAIHVSLWRSDHHDDATLLLLLLLFPLHSCCAFPVGSWAEDWKSLYECNVYVHMVLTKYNSGFLKMKLAPHWMCVLSFM